jgi:hypothetical protein
MDVGSSVPLDGNRSLFLFGDTFYGGWHQDGTRDVAGAVHSATAVVDRSALATCFAGSSFAMSGSRVAQWLEPIDGLPGDAVWPLGPAIARDGRVDLLYSWVRSDSSNPLGFEVLGNGIVGGDSSAAGLPVDAATQSAPASEAMPSAWLVAGAYAYLYRCGSQLGWGADPCIVGRAPLADRARHDAYAYFVADGGYTGTYAHATPVTQGAPAFTVSWNSYLQAYLEVYVEPFSHEVSARQAPAPEGPFSEKVRLWLCSLPKDDPKSDCYSGYEHPELDSSDGRTVVITYSTNSELASMVRHPNLYWPRLFSLDLATTRLHAGR